VRTLRLPVVVGLVVLMVGACSSSGSTPTAPPPTASPTIAPTAAPADSPSPVATPAATPPASVVPGQAVASLAFAGVPVLAGGLTHQIVRCNEPTKTGDVIAVSGSASDGSFLAYITATAGDVTVRLTQSQGSSLYERTFDTAGVSGFDAARGASISGDLIESTPAGTKTGTIGAPTSLSGSIDCAGQQRGTAAITLTGTLPEGTLNTQIGSARVECVNNPAGSSIDVIGVVTLGGSPVIATVDISSGQALVTIVAGSGYYYLTASGADAGKLTGPDSGTVNGTATGTGNGGGATQQLEVSGTATCGTTVTYGGSGS
jgi:hypothetical protein